MQKRESDRPLVLTHLCLFFFFFTFLTATACVGFGLWPGTCMEQVRLTSPGTVPQAGPTHGEVQKGADDPGRRPGAVRPAEAVATASPGPPARPRVPSGFCRRGPPSRPGSGAVSCRLEGLCLHCREASRLAASPFPVSPTVCPTVSCVSPSCGPVWTALPTSECRIGRHSAASEGQRDSCVPESDARGLPGPRAQATDSRPALKPGVGLTVTRLRD